MKKTIKIFIIIAVVLVLVMIGKSLANFILAVSVNNGQTVSAGSGKYQIVRMDLTYSGYNPNVLSVKKGIPVRWIINAQQMSGCTNSIILRGAYNISKDLQLGENVIEFTPQQTGEIPFSCWMGMVRGKFIVQ